MPVQVAMALSGIDREQWGDFKELFDCGANVIKQERPRATRSRATNSIGSSRSSSPSCSSSGIGSMTANSPIPLTLRDYCLFKIEAMQYADKRALEIIEIFDIAGKQDTEVMEVAKQKPYQVSTELKWTGRNLLDLGANMKGNATMYRSATIPRGVPSYFQNRSQISRLNGARTPLHKIEECSTDDCNFQNYLFF